MTKGYGQNCPVAHSLDIIGERWSLLILRNLFLHKSQRFQDFQNDLTGIGPNTLSARLKTLESGGIIARRFYEDHPPRAEYILTEKGEALAPVLKALRNWGETFASK